MLSSIKNISNFRKSFTKKSMMQKMFDCEYFSLSDPEIQERYLKTVDLCHKLNQIPTSDQESKRKILKEIFGYEPDIWVAENFNCQIGNVKFGKNCGFNFNCCILDDALIEFGDDVLVAPNVTITSSNHPLNPSLRKANLGINKRVKIGNNVWIGSNAVITPGVTIGDNSVIGAGAVVVKDIPPNSVAVGNPARVIKHIEDTKEDPNKYLE